MTAQQIVSTACSIAKVPGYTVQGGQFLNLVLQDLCLHRDLQMNRVTSTITIQAGTNGPFTLEGNYLRTYDLFYLQNGLPYFLNDISLKQYDAEFKSVGISNFPYEYATDLSPLENQQPALLYVYPQSSGQIALTHRYMLQQPDISNPQTSATIPWFPDQNYLIKATALQLMNISDDERQEMFTAQCESMLRIHLIMDGDEQSVLRSVELDPRTFRIRKSLKPTKLTD